MNLRFLEILERGNYINNVRTLTDDEINRFRNELQLYDNKYRVMFEIGLFTDLRVSDILNLKAGKVKNRPFTV